MADPPDPLSLRAEQVRHTRAALIAAGRRLFGERGFAATSVEDLASEARVTTGALYHHFRNKTALFETVLEEVHADLLAASARSPGGTADDLETLARSFEAFLDGVLQPQVQQILFIDAPAVLGLARFTQLDESYALTRIVAALGAATAAGTVCADDPETVTRMLLGALARGGMLIAGAASPGETRDAVARTIRAMLAGVTRVPPRQ